MILDFFSSLLRFLFQDSIDCIFFNTPPTIGDDAPIPTVKPHLFEKDHKIHDLRPHRSEVASPHGLRPHRSFAPPVAEPLWPAATAGFHLKAESESHVVACHGRGPYTFGTFNLYDSSHFGLLGDGLQLDPVGGRKKQKASGIQRPKNRRRSGLTGRTPRPCVACPRERHDYQQRRYIFTAGDHSAAGSWTEKEPQYFKYNPSITDIMLSGTDMESSDFGSPVACQKPSIARSTAPKKPKTKFLGFADRQEPITNLGPQPSGERSHPSGSPSDGPEGPALSGHRPQDGPEGPAESRAKRPVSQARIGNQEPQLTTLEPLVGNSESQILKHKSVTGVVPAYITTKCKIQTKKRDYIEASHNPPESQPHAKSSAGRHAKSGQRKPAHPEPHTLVTRDPMECGFEISKQNPAAAQRSEPDTQQCAAQGHNDEPSPTTSEAQKTSSPDSCSSFQNLATFLLSAERDNLQQCDNESSENPFGSFSTSSDSSIISEINDFILL